MKKKIHNLLIIDASGSMSKKVEEVTGGINQIFSELKEDAITHKEIKNRISVVDFSSHGDFNVLYRSAKPNELVELKDGDYKPRSMTALYDAIGKAFEIVPEKNDGVFVTIFTDGMENDSKEFTPQTIKQLITHKESNGWTITFMGTTKEAMIQAQSLGIREDRMLQYQDSKQGTTAAINRLKKARKKYAGAIQMSLPVENIFDKENRDDTMMIKRIRK